MIYLTNTDNSQEVQIPRSLPTPADASLSLVLRNTITHSETTYSVSDASETDLYYLFSVTLDGEDSGEYEYSVLAGEDILAQGVLRILDSDDTAQVEVEQYEPTYEIAQYGRTE